MSDLAVFDRHLRQWALAACEEWYYEPPPIEWYEAIHERIPPGLRATLGSALQKGVIHTVDNHKFTVAGIPEVKGPYAWFSRDDQKLALAPNWEYFVQAAVFARMQAIYPGCDVGFEDRLMDVSVSRYGDLLWYIEIKEQVGPLAALAGDIRRHGAAGVDMAAEDRGNDPLRKAKILIELRPPYFSLIGIGGRLDFSIAYHDQNRFELISDLVSI